MKEDFLPPQISDKVFFEVDYAKIENRISAIVGIDSKHIDTGRQTSNNYWLTGTPLSGRVTDAEKDKKLLLSFATKYPFMRTEDPLLAGIVYFLVSFRHKSPPIRRKNKFYRKMGRLFDVNRKELKIVFEKLYPLITMQEKLFPASKWRMPPYFKQPKLRKEFNYSIKMPKEWKNDYLTNYLNQDMVSVFKEAFG